MELGATTRETLVKVGMIELVQVGQKRLALVEHSVFRHCIQNEITFPTKDHHTSSCVLHAKATCYHPINTRWRNCFPSWNFLMCVFFLTVTWMRRCRFFQRPGMPVWCQKIPTELPRAVILGRGMTYWFISVCATISDRSMSGNVAVAILSRCFWQKLLSNRVL